MLNITYHYWKTLEYRSRSVYEKVFGNCSPTLHFYFTVDMYFLPLVLFLHLHLLKFFDRFLFEILLYVVLGLIGFRKRIVVNITFKNDTTNRNILLLVFMTFIYKIGH